MPDRDVTIQAKRLMQERAPLLQQGEQLSLVLPGATLMMERVGRHYLLLAEYARPDTTLSAMFERVDAIGDSSMQVMVYRNKHFLASIRTVPAPDDIDTLYAALTA